MSAYHLLFTGYFVGSLTTALIFIFNRYYGHSFADKNRKDFGINFSKFFSEITKRKSFYLQRNIFLFVLSIAIISVCFSFVLFVFISVSPYGKSTVHLKEPQIASASSSVVPNSIISQSIPQNNVQHSKKDEINQNFLKDSSIVKENLSTHNINKSDYWYIIQLISGENLITQNATENDGIITVLKFDGSERKFRRAEVKSVKKTQL
ncbi:MAG: hypothetical protein P4L42_14885 [Desulfocapsaceae bacterium]|nr:hypothetical protein [Desulfocapsaceae bacterium]